MRKIYIDGKECQYIQHKAFPDEHFIRFNDKWIHLVIDEQTQEPERNHWNCKKCGEIVEHPSDVHSCENEPECSMCGMSTKIRNPSGWCDHLHYPDNIAKEKPAKKEWGTKGAKGALKDELSERFKKLVLKWGYDEEDAKPLADEARNWALEILEDEFRKHGGYIQFSELRDRFRGHNGKSN